jgi:protein-disulfide isomerase
MMQSSTRIGLAIVLCVALAGLLVYLPEKSAHTESMLLSDPDSPAIGNPYGNPVIVVVFSDYHCPPCKDLSNSLQMLVGEDTHLRVIFKEYPILSENSQLAARSALAVSIASEGKYFAYHQALMQSSSTYTPEFLAELAGQADIAPEAYAKALQNPRIDQEIARNLELARQLNISGVPAVVIGHKILTGDSIDRIKAAIAEVRASQAEKPH